LNGEVVERFSSVEAAVEAVDYEIDQMGPRAAASARPEAAWRNERAPDGITRAQVLQQALWQRLHPRNRPKTPPT